MIDMISTAFPIVMPTLLLIIGVGLGIMYSRRPHSRRYHWEVDLADGKTVTGVSSAVEAYDVANFLEETSGEFRQIRVYHKKHLRYRRFGEKWTPKAGR